MTTRIKNALVAWTDAALAVEDVEKEMKTLNRRLKWLWKHQDKCRLRYATACASAVTMQILAQAKADAKVQKGKK